MKYTFEMAIVFLKQGKRIRRVAWRQVWRHGFKWIEMVDGRLYEILELRRFMLFLTSEDILAEDWEVME